MRQRARRACLSAGVGVSVRIDMGEHVQQGWTDQTSIHASVAGGPSGASRSFVMSGAGAVVAVPVRQEPDHWALAAVRQLARLVVPVLALIIAVFAVFLFSDERVMLLDPLFAGFDPALVPSQWLNWGLVAAPAGVFAVQMASRRYGPGLALTQIGIAWVLLAIITLGGAGFSRPLFDHVTMPAPPVALALAAALMVSQFVAALVFDAVRCVRWWQAPLISGLWAGLFFGLVFYPFAYLGANAPWFGFFLIHFGIMVAEAFGLLVIYWAFRPLVHPLPGYAGY